MTIKNSIGAGMILCIALVVGLFVFSVGIGANQANALDEFAQCLRGRGFTMYGAYWCPHCQNEKAAFGAAFNKVDYVECTKEPNRCVAAKVNSYPTWIGPEGMRLEGEQGIEGLSKASGCLVEDARVSQ